VARTVFGERPRDVLLYTEMGLNALNWLGAVFHAIELLHERGGSSLEIKRLAGLGRYIADDIGDHIGLQHEAMAECIAAAEAAEGGAA
jgi:hypothetical protein